MATSIDKLVNDLRSFDRKREVVKALGKEIRKPLPGVRKSIKARALEILPRAGGLNKWVASTRVGVKVRTSGRSAGVQLKGGRNSAQKRSDVRAIDRGRVRAPSWGKRTAASWHTQSVTPGFFTDTAGDATEWRDACVQAVDNAIATIARG